MKLRLSHFIFVITLGLILSTSTTYGFKAEWSIDAPGGGYDYETFVVEKDSYFIQMTVEVYEGGPVSAFILDEFAIEDLFTYGQPVVAYLGGKNITLGNPRTFEGYLGLARDNYTGEHIDYYIVIDNRGEPYYTNVFVQIVATIPGFSALFTLLALIPISLVVYNKKRR